MGAAVIFVAAYLAAADGGGVGDALSSVNFPAVAVLATSGVIGLFVIIRWMVKYQREFTDLYVDENNKLRARIDTLEAECITKDAEIAELKRAGLEYDKVISRHETTIERLTETVAWHEKTIERHEATITDLRERGI